MPEYTVITPARDEERFLPQLIASVVAQKHVPKRWTIIDDCSTDATAGIIDAAAARYSWIKPVHLAGDLPRLPGGESVIMQFLQKEALSDIDYVLRLDADISFGPDFVESLLKEFGADPKLGIASATLYEPHDGQWHEVVNPSFHTCGPTKMYSCACLTAIGGLKSCLGWDTIDEIRAIMLGFNTRSFRRIRADHHRPQGTASGRWRGFFNKGRAAYYAGYSPIFHLARAARMAFSSPLGAIIMSAGYFEGYIRRRPMVDDAELIRFVRRQQHLRLMMLDTVWR